jgi:hypothetical protein
LSFAKVARHLLVWAKNCVCGLNDHCATKAAQTGIVRGTDVRLGPP